MTDSLLRILVLEDEPADYMLLERHMIKHKLAFTCHHVSNRAQLEPAFAEDWDVMLSDYNVPGLDFLQTLRQVRARWPDLPVILVSGSVGEERAIDLLHEGVTDFVLKDNLARMVPAIRRALDEVTERRARRAAEAELRRNEQMALAEQKLHAETLQAAVDHLMVMNTELERFAVIAAHDLREPLRSIISFAQMLERRCSTKLDATEHDYIRFLVDGANRMNDLIAGLLSYSRATATSETTRMVSTQDAMDMALENLAVAIIESGATITQSDLPQVQGMTVMLVQLFQNLIANALKFRASERPLCIRVAAERRDGDWHFTVSDNGIGFDPNEQDVFELFLQLGPREHRTGAGVGLAICKRVVQKLGGTIWAESTPGIGSVFHFILPAA